MAACHAPDCGKPSARRPFCRDCERALQPGELWTLRVAYLAPFYAPTSWPWVDGSERLRVTTETALGPEWTQAKGVVPICRVLQWLEYELALQAAGAALAARRKGQRDRERLAMLARVTGRRR
jgi:hypothetical protein